MKTTSIFALILIFSVGCQKLKNGCKETKNTSALIMDFPDSIEVNETFYLQVRYVLENSCGSFSHFEIMADNGTTDIAVVSKYEGCKCDLEFIERTSTFPLQIANIGIYDYRFWLSGSEWDEYTIKVYQ